MTKFLSVVLIFILFVSCDQGSSGGSSDTGGRVGGQSSTSADGNGEASVIQLSCIHAEKIVEVMNRVTIEYSKEHESFDVDNLDYQFLLGLELGRFIYTEPIVTEKVLFELAFPSYNKVVTYTNHLRFDIFQGHEKASSEYSKFATETFKQYTKCK